MVFKQKNRPTACLFVIFGATGDLTHRKLLPALYNLKQKNLLPKNFVVIGVARRDKTHEDFRADALQSAKRYIKHFNPKVWKELSSKIYYTGKTLILKSHIMTLKNF
jgi:glucose-6-phosphate 1-dehydrogenase